MVLLLVGTGAGLASVRDSWLSALHGLAPSLTAGALSLGALGLGVAHGKGKGAIRGLRDGWRAIVDFFRRFFHRKPKRGDNPAGSLNHLKLTIAWIGIEF
jgi:hypothetical protein